MQSWRVGASHIQLQMRKTMPRCMFRPLRQKFRRQPSALPARRDADAGYEGRRHGRIVAIDRDKSHQFGAGPCFEARREERDFGGIIIQRNSLIQWWYEARDLRDAPQCRRRSRRSVEISTPRSWLEYCEAEAEVGQTGCRCKADRLGPGRRIHAGSIAYRRPTRRWSRSSGIMSSSRVQHFRSLEQAWPMR